MNPFLQSPFVQIALPIMITLVATIWIASWSQNKRFDDLRQDMDHRFSELRRDLDQIIVRLDRIELKLEGHEQRLVRLEERTSLVGRRNP